MTDSMVYNQNYSVPLQHSRIDMVRNQSYSVSLSPTDHPLTTSTNIYEAPQ